MKINADLHIHSRFSISVSKNMTVKNLAKDAPMKGIQMIGCGDCLHETWLNEVTALPEVDEGTYELDGTRFLLSCEVENFHKVHHVLLFPARSAVEEFRAGVQNHSKNLRTDGRPNIKLSSVDIAQLAKDVGAMIGPAHAFTPWTAMYSAYDSLEECYGDLAGHIRFVELGLSADTSYADRISELHRLTFLTNSDAHSPRPRRIAREFNKLDVKEMTAKEVFMAIKREGGRKPVLNVGLPPDLGKYNESACIKCFDHVYLNEAEMSRWKCKKCGGRIKKGVWDRINELADHEIPMHPKHRPPYVHIIPLSEIISEALGKGPDTKTVGREWKKLIDVFRDEVKVLLDAKIDQVLEIAHPNVGRAIEYFRDGKVVLLPGGGGDYGKVVIPRSGQKITLPRPKMAGKKKGGQFKLSDFH